MIHNDNNNYNKTMIMIIISVLVIYVCTPLSIMLITLQSKIISYDFLKCLLPFKIYYLLAIFFLDLFF